MIVTKALEELQKISPARFKNFFLSQKNDSVTAYRLIQEYIQEGESLEKLFTPRKYRKLALNTEERSDEVGHGFLLKVTQLHKNKYEIEAGYAYKTIGDGGAWVVEFDDADNVVECIGWRTWVC
jgi:hypothetical protein